MPKPPLTKESKTTSHPDFLTRNTSLRSMPCRRTEEWHSTCEVLSLSGVKEEQHVYRLVLVLCSILLPLCNPC